jgi:hypothetical protein
VIEQKSRLAITLAALTVDETWKQCVFVTLKTLVMGSCGLLFVEIPPDYSRLFKAI